MNKNLFGIVIKVRDLELCRNFYRNILELGQPVMDSSFQVEFKAGGSSLILVRKSWDCPLPQHSERIAWYFSAGNPDHIREKIFACGYRSVCTISEKAGREMVMFTDPEGNPFYVPGKLTDKKGKAK